jgi:hypothetical protein
MKTIVKLFLKHLYKNVKGPYIYSSIQDRMIRNGKPWHGAERYLAYVLSSKRTQENGLGRL